MIKVNPCQIFSYIIFLSIWVFTIYTGAIGIDFGRHWDERKLFASIIDTIPNGDWVPGWYNYPSMVYDLVVLSETPEIATTYIHQRSEFSNILETSLSKKMFVFRARTVFLHVVALSLLWVFTLIFKWTKQWSHAVLGPAILASSWEFAYHARWLAPDGVLMQFGILTILLVFLALGSSMRRRTIWLLAAATAAGMACGTKYYGGIFLLPVFIGGQKVLADKNAKTREYLLLFISLAAAFVITFLLITPGALTDTSKFIQDIQFEINHYRSGHPGYSVHTGNEHATLLLLYLSSVFYSRYMWVSLAFSVFALIGLYNILRNGWKKHEVWILLSVPLFYIPYISMQKVMMVRNYLLLFPFLAILSAIGYMAVWKTKWVQSITAIKFAISAGLIFALSMNYGWLYTSAKSIVTRKAIDQPQVLQNYLVANKETTFYLSNAARQLLSETDPGKMQNITDNPSQAEVYIYLSHEVENPDANRPGIYKPIAGPYEVNFDYYPSWDGDSRIIVMRMEDAFHQAQFGFISK